MTSSLRRRFARVIRIALAALAMSVVGAVAAPRARADEAAARAHFKRGVELYDRKEYAAALEAFKAAYAEKPYAGIKQNIALSLKGLGRVVEAATSFDEALDEGAGTLKPETRTAIERELAELSKVVATIDLKVVDAENKPIANAVVTIDGTPLPPGALRRPIRISQGMHTIAAHVEGFPDPPPKKLAPLLGERIDASFVFGGEHASASAAGASSTLNVRASVPDAVIRLDGVDIGRGSWSGKVPPGAHKLEISAPGHRTATIDVTVPAGATIEYPVQLALAGDVPAPYEHTDRAPPREKKLYIVPMLAGQIESFRLSGALDEPPSGTRRSFAGVSVGVRGGYRFGKMLAGELHLEAGQLQASYKLRDSDALETETTIGHWQLTPALRFNTRGRVRFVMSTGFGVHGNSVAAKLVHRAGRVDRNGSGVGLSWLADAGLQIQTGAVFLELLLFVDVHGVGAVRDQTTDARLLQASPAARGGLRFGLGIPF